MHHNAKKKFWTSTGKHCQMLQPLTSLKFSRNPPCPESFTSIFLTKCWNCEEIATPMIQNQKIEELNAIENDE